MIIAMTGSLFDATPHSPVGTAKGKPVPSPATVLVHVPLLKKLDLSRNPNLSGTTGRTFLGLYNLEELNLAFSSNIANANEKDFTVLEDREWQEK